MTPGFRQHLTAAVESGRVKGTHVDIMEQVIAGTAWAKEKEVFLGRERAGRLGSGHLKRVSAFLGHCAFQSRLSYPPSESSKIIKAACSKIIQV